MSTHPKAAPSNGESARPAGLYRVAIVGASTLTGKEVAEVLNDRNFPALDVKLLDDDESIGKLENVRDEVTFIQSVRAEQFENIDFTFFATDQGATRKTWKTARQSGSTIIDLSYALENEPNATVRAPWIERQVGRVLVPELQPGPAIIAHPAALTLAALLLRANKGGTVKSAVATVFEPASERGQKGMDELHEQTVNLLSFQQLPKNVFDVQVAFNMVSRYGEQAVPPLASVQQRILRHYQRLAGKDALLPSLLVVQAPIFHGYAVALHLEMEQAADIALLSQSLAGEHVIVTHLAEDAPSNVNAAGRGDVLISLALDAEHAHGVWLWVALDNLRLAASTAVECAENLAASRPKGKIQ
jgi:aspartate-semialdehyde dehydrogenase